MLRWPQNTKSIRTKFASEATVRMASGAELDFYEFDGFRAYPRKRRLEREHKSVPLYQKTFDVLMTLLKRHGKVVPYPDLIQSSWPGRRVGDENKMPDVLRTQIYRINKALAKAFGQELDEHRFIKNVPGCGYIFVAEVREVHTSSSVEGESPSSAGESAPERLPRTARRLRAVILGASAGVMAIAFFVLLRRPSSPSLSEQELTRQLSDDPVTAVAISPNGKYLAYGKRSGLEMREIDTGTTARIPVNGLSAILGLDWFHDGSALLVTGKDSQTNRAGLWQVSPSANFAQKLREDVSRAAASPDGKRIAFVDDSGRRVWLMTAHGSDSQVLFSGAEGDRIPEIMWSPDGKRILLGRLHLGAFNLQIRIESLNEDGQLTTVVDSNPGLRAFRITADGRLLTAVAEAPPHQDTTSLWEYKVDWSDGTASKPRRIGTSPGSNIYGLSVAAEVRRLIVLRGSYHAAIYVADLQQPGVLQGEPRRLTNVKQNDLPTAWSPDGNTLFLHSDRGGKWSIWKQHLNGTSAELVMSGPGDDRGPRISPDGRWLYFFERALGHQIWQWVTPGKLIRTTPSGGQPETLLEKRAPFSFRCPRDPSQSCVLGERGWGKISFYFLDPERGRGDPLPAVATDAPLDQNNWDLSPDGAEIAVVIADSHESGRIRVLHLKRGTTEDITVDRRGGFQSIDWSADGQGWYVSSGSAQGAEIIFIDRRGHATTVRDQPGSFGTWAIPSPDGKRLAILEWYATGNAFLVEGF